MKSSRSLAAVFLTLLLLLVPALARDPGLASPSSSAAAPKPRLQDWEVAAVHSSTYNGYERQLRPDGTPEPETFAIGEGTFENNVINDSSIDRMRFGEICRTLAPALAAQRYVSGTTPENTTLLIVAHWGMTGSPSSMFASSSGSGVGVGAMDSAKNRFRDLASSHNARILGYAEELAAHPHSPWLFRGQTMTMAGDRDYYRLVEELEDERYYVVLIAYDFQKLWKQKERKILWETRFSIRAYNNWFNEALPSMVAKAAPFFGRASHGLQRDVVTEVKFGELKMLEEQN